MKHISGKRMCRVLEGNGWTCIRTKGSHHIYAHPDRPGVVVPVPVHGNHTLKAGIQHGIMKEAGLTEKDL